MSNQVVLDLPGRPALDQLAWAIDEIAHAARRLDDSALRRFEAHLALAREQIAAELQQRESTARQPAGTLVEALPIEPIAVSPRRAAELIGVGHPLFYKEVMPFVYSGAILSCQLGRHRVILLDSLRAWMERAARDSSTCAASG